MCFSVRLAHASKINLWTLSSFFNSPMALTMEFVYAHLVDSAGAQQHQVSCHGHITTCSIYRIEVVTYTQVIHLNIPTAIPSNVCTSSSIFIVIVVGDFFNHLMTLLILMQLYKNHCLPRILIFLIGKFYLQSMRTISLFPSTIEEEGSNYIKLGISYASI